MELCIKLCTYKNFAMAHWLSQVLST